MFAGGGQLHCKFLRACCGLGGHRQVAAETIRRLGVTGADIGIRREAEAYAASLVGSITTPQLCIRIIGREHGNAVGRQATDHAAVFFGNRRHARHELLMLALCVVDQRYCRFGKRCQQRNFTGMVHTQLNHGSLMAGLKPQQGQRNANLVIEIAARRQRFINTKSRDQDRGNHFFYSGLAVAAGDGNQWQRKLLPPALPYRAECDPSVVHQQCRYRQRRWCAFHHHCCRALGNYLIEEIMGVETLATQCDKQRTWRHRTAISAQTIHHDLAASGGQSQPRLQLLQ